jgi:hypothetical protein
VFDYRCIYYLDTISYWRPAISLWKTGQRGRAVFFIRHVYIVLACTPPGPYCISPNLQPHLSISTHSILLFKTSQALFRQYVYEGHPSFHRAPRNTRPLLRSLLSLHRAKRPRHIQVLGRKPLDVPRPCLGQPLYRQRSKLGFRRCWVGKRVYSVRVSLLLSVVKNGLCRCLREGREVKKANECVV